MSSNIQASKMSEMSGLSISEAEPLLNNKVKTSRSLFESKKKQEKTGSVALESKEEQKE